MEHKREDKLADRGKKLNFQNYFCKVFTENQQRAVKEEPLFAGKCRPTKSLVKRQKIADR